MAKIAGFRRTSFKSRGKKWLVKTVVAGCERVEIGHGFLSDRRLCVEYSKKYYDDTFTGEKPLFYTSDLSVTPGCADT
jgi:hypothetical protein